MATGSKRKRDADLPRITYHAPGRTFDRLFKEDSLGEMKDVVRRKLGLAADTSIKLLQLREGISIDLEDEDDFDAFSSVAHSISMINVQVALGGGILVSGSRSTTKTPISGDKKQKKKQSAAPLPGNSGDTEPNQGGQPADSLSPVPAAKKRRVSFVSADIEAKETPKKKKKRKIGSGEETTPAASGEADSSSSRPGASQPSNDEIAPSEGDLADSTTTESEPAKHKRKREKSGAEAEPPTPEAPATESAVVEHAKRKKTHKKSDISKDTQLPSLLAAVINETGASNSKSLNQDANATENTAEEEATTKPTEVLSATKTKAGEKSTKKNKPTKVVTKKTKEVAPSKAQGQTSKEKKKAVSKAAEAAKATSENQKDQANGAEEGSNPPSSERSKSRLSKDISTAMAIVLARHGTATPVPPTKKPSASDRQEQVASTSVKDTQTQKAKKSSATPAKAGPSKSKESQFVNQPVAAPMTPILAASTPKTFAAAAACPLCLQTPLHVRHQCPVTLGGIESMKLRILELQKDKTMNNADRLQVIEELQNMVKRKSKEEKQISKVNGQSAPVSLPSPPVDTQLQVISDALDAVPGAVKKVVAVNGRSKSHAGKMMPAHSMDEDSSSSSSSSDSDDSDEKATITKNVNTTIQPLPALDLSAFGDVDLQALIHGPNASLSVADIVTPESTEEEEAEENMLEEDEEEKKKSRHHGKTYAADSSDEGEDNDEQDENAGSAESPAQEQELSIDKPEDENAFEQPASEELGDVSFGDVNDLGSSMEVDRTGDAAFSDALAEDNAIFKLTEADSDAQSSGATTEASDGVASAPDGTASALNGTASAPDGMTSADVDTVEKVVEVNGLGEKVATAIAVPTTRRRSARQSSQVHEPPPDPIESFESPEPLHSSLITPEGGLESVEMVRQSTPKPRLVEQMRARSARRPQELLASITLLPNAKPSVNSVVKLSSTQPVETTTARRTRSSTRAASQPTAPADTPTIKKAPAKTPAKRGRPRKDAAQASEVVEPNGKAPSQKPTSKAKGKRAATASPEQTEETEVHTEIPAPASSFTDAWATLSQRGSSIAPEGDTAVMVDELQSSSPPPPSVKRGRGRPPKKKDDTVLLPTDAEEPDTPLFLPSESQQPDTQTSDPPVESVNEPSSPNDSDDEDEVEATIVKSQPMTIRKPSIPYRRLTDIASQSTLFPTRTPSNSQLRPAQFISAKDRVAALYGKTGDEDEDSDDSDSDSDSEAEQKQPSHIPQSRRAGAAGLK